MKMSDVHSEIQADILNYLAAHPEACGSVKAISNQWLANEKNSHNIAQVQTAVDRLVSRGELHRRSNSNQYTL